MTESMQEPMAADPHIPDAGNEAQADQRAQLEHDEQLQSIIRKVINNDHNHTPWHRALYASEIVLLCHACGINIRDVT